MAKVRRSYISSVCSDRVTLTSHCILYVPSTDIFVPLFDLQFRKNVFESTRSL